MKRTIPLVMAFALLLAAMPAQAFETRTQDPAQRTLLQVMGQAFTPAASTLGCPVLVAANYSDPENRSAMLEYLPQGQTLDNWTRMFSVSVYTLDDDAARQKITMMALSGALLKAFEQHGKVLQNQHYANAAGEPGMFIEFEMGQGAQKEHNAGVFMRTSKQAAAFFQVQSRGKPLSKEDVLAIHKMITPNPQEAPPSDKPNQTAPTMPQPFPLPSGIDAVNPAPITPAPDVADIPEEQALEDIPPGLWEGEPAWRLEMEQDREQETQPAKSWLERR